MLPTLNYSELAKRLSSPWKKRYYVVVLLYKYRNKTGKWEGK